MQDGDILYIVENDSTDHTKKFLYDFANHHRGVALASSDECVPSFPSVVNLERTTNLAVFRNKYLHYAKTMHRDNGFQYMIVFDSDMHDLPVENFETMFTEHAAVTSNGLCTNRYYDENKQIRTRSVYYDAWAYQALEDDTIHVGSDPTESYTVYYNAQPKFPERNDLLEVRSGFGGLAVYKIDDIKDCQYHPYEFGGKKAALCEHGGFNQDIRAAGGKVFINTNYQPIVQAV